MTWWGDVLKKPYDKVHVGGRIAVYQNFSVQGGGEPYGLKERCQVGFELPPGVVDRMTK
ncbi:MAG TPA: hypothetical protein VMI15_03195 [Burkholderiales bacterium]|nr:hypothetical protein [Burkholderiales bacterium]